MAQYFPPKRNFSSLSVQDLLEAREAYHVHLAHLENVVATAIGRYRIRRIDPDFHAPNGDSGARRKGRSRAAQTHAGEPRTLENTVVRPWSWPCVLVFVDKWQPRSAFAREPDQMVPRSLYLPDGRVIPTCVIYTQERAPAAADAARLNFPSNLVGGGYLVQSDSQGGQRVGSIGCMVTDGDLVYALTNRHVAGPKGRVVYADMRGDRIILGTSDEKQVGKEPFDKIYAGWPGNRTLLNLDAGLIRIEDMGLWTTQVFGLGEIAEPVDLNVDTLSLDLVGCPVRAFGGASGVLTGEIQGLFYRYRSIGGTDEVADLLIGPRPDARASLLTMPGDSGTLWFFDPPADGTKAAKDAGGENPATRTEGPQSPATNVPRLRPIAMQWGGHVTLDAASQGEFHYALATCLSTVCRSLDVAVVRDFNTGHPEYWGPVGHYTVGAKAIGLLKNAKLRTLMTANVDRVSFAEGTIQGGNVSGADADGYFPLADVPDTVWKTIRPHEKPNHYADMDLEGKGAFAGKDLLAICQKVKDIRPKVWLDYYQSVGITPSKQGSLPFRVWQIFDAMVGYVSAGDMLRFVAAAGVLAHYVGDGCQPLHGSQFADGSPTIPNSSGVHTAYETAMIKSKRVQLFALLPPLLQNRTITSTIQKGHEAAVALVTLMKKTRETLSPEEIIQSYVSNNHMTGAMWTELGPRTAAVIAEGCVTLASLWESAWRKGGGASIAQSKLKTLKKGDLEKVYKQEAATFVPSLYLPEMVAKPNLFPDP